MSIFIAPLFGGKLITFSNPRLTNISLALNKYIYYGMWKLLNRAG